MNIRGLYIDGFGAWNGLSLEEFDDGLTLIYGPNEAGKTTLLEFIRSMLYGYSPARQKYLPPVHGGDGGGWLDIAADEQLRIERSFTQVSQAKPGEKLFLRGPEGNELPGQRLGDLLGNVDEAVFRNVFAVGLREIQELGTLADTEAAAMLYRLAAGMDRVSLLDVVQELGASRRRLLDPEGGKGQLVELRAQWQQLRSELEERGKLTRRYSRMLGERNQLDREVERLEAENHDLERQARLVELAITLRDRWTRRAELDAQLDVMGPVGDLPEGAIEQLDQLSSRLGRYRERGRTIKREREQLREEFNQAPVNAALWRQAPRIEALREQQSWIEGLQRRVAELEAEVGHLDDGLSSRRQRIGMGQEWTARDLPMVSSRTIASLRPAARAVRRCRERLEKAKRQADDARQTAEELSRQIDDALAERDYTDLTTALDDVGGRVAQLRQRQQIDQRLEEMTSYQEDLETRNRQLVDRQLLSLPALAGFGLLFALGVMLIMAGLVGGLSASWLTGSMAWAMALLGAIGVVGAAVGKAVMERTNFRRMEACQKQVQLLGVQIEHTRRERQAFDDASSPDALPVENRLEAAQRELAALEELVPLDGRRNTARQDAHAAVGHVNLAEQELNTANRRWQQALRSLGLPTNLGPRQVKQLGSDYEQVHQLSQRAESGREELASRRRELTALHDRIRQLVRACGVRLSASSPMEQLDELAAAAAEQDTLLTRRRQIRRRARRLQRKLAQAVAAVRSLNRRRQALLRRLGATDEQEFRRRALEADRAAVLRRDRDSLTREIRAALANAHSEEELAAQLEDATAESLEARRDQLLERLEAIESRRKQHLEARGRLGEQLRSLGDDRETAYKRLELAALEKRLEQAADRWRVLAVTSHTLDSIRSEYEQSRQPEALRQASGYLERFTDGRYRRVWTPLGEDVLRVEDAEHNMLPVEVLSRGTREQLFLSLRMALAGCYARDGVTLPMVLDDVLVNFDAARAKAAARTLRDFAAEGRQLLVFTCHEHIVKLFKPLKVRITELPDRTNPGRVSVSVAPPAPKRRRKPKKSASPPQPVVEEPVVEQPEPPTMDAELETPPEACVVVDPPVVGAATVTVPFEMDSCVEPLEVETAAEEDSLAPIAAQYPLIDEADLEEEWEESEDPPEEELEEEFEGDVEEEDEYFEEELDEEEDEENEDELPVSATDAVFDADYFDSRETDEDLDEEEADDDGEEEYEYEYEYEDEEPAETNEDAYDEEEDNGEGDEWYEYAEEDEDDEEDYEYEDLDDDEDDERLEAA